MPRLAVLIFIFVFASLFFGTGSDMARLSAQVMQSPSYQIEFDSINFGGGFSESDSYRMEDTGGEIASGDSDSASYQIRAGYQQMNETYLAMSAVSNVVLLPDIGGITGGIASGTADVTVTTDNLAGYELTILASSSPALVHMATSTAFADYVPSGAAPDFAFVVGANDKVFGFTIEGNDIVSRFLDNGTDTCDIGVLNTSNACWDGLSSVTPAVIASRANSNHPAGTTLTLRFRAGAGASANPVGGLYQATTTLTLTAR